MTSRTAARSWRRWIVCAAACASAFLLLSVLTRLYCRWNPAVLVTDPTLATTHLLQACQGGEIACQDMICLRGEADDGGDLLLLHNDQYRAVLSIKDGLVTFLHQKEVEPSDRRLQAVDCVPEPGLVWSFEYPDTVSHRLVLVSPTATGTPVKRFEPIQALSKQRSAVGRQGSWAVACWPERNPRRVFGAMVSSGRSWPRGVACFDYAEGSLRWRYDMAQDPQIVIVRDLWDDEAPELFVAGWAPANGNEIAGGRCDTTCSLIALDSGGKEIWYRESGRTFDYSTAVLGKMAPDREERLVWVVTSHSNRTIPMTTMYSIEPRSGEILAEQRFPGACFSPVLSDLDGDGCQELIGGTSIGQLMVWDGRLHLLANRRFDAPLSVLLAVDLDQDARDDLVGAIGGRLCVWSDRLEVKAFSPYHLPDQTQRLMLNSPRHLGVMREADGHPFLALADDQWKMRFFSLAPRSPSEGLGLNARQISPLLAMAILLGAAAGGLLLRRRSTPSETAATQRPEVLSPPMAKALHQEISGVLHAVDRTNPLVRLQQLLDFLAKGNTAGPQQIARVADACQAFLAEGEPGLVRLTERLGEARAELPDLERLEESYRRLTEIVRGLDGAGYSPSQVQASAARGTELAGAALQSLRGVQATLRSRLRCDLLHALDHAVRGEMPQIRDGGVEGIDIQLEGSGPTAVLCEPGDLQTVLANLIHNGVRAMAESPTRRLQFRVSRRASTVLLTVEDSGKGIERERWERIFGPDGSEREGGGFGLPHARRVLQEYKGWCEVEWSEPGRGTRMLLSFQSADGGEDAA